MGHPVTELRDVIEAVTEFASRAAEKLRKQDSLRGKFWCLSASVRFDTKLSAAGRSWCPCAVQRQILHVMIASVALPTNYQALQRQKKESYSNVLLWTLNV